jgi:acyl-CoA synthetase (AMP-forming)/AMP-acid ligase II
MVMKDPQKDRKTLEMYQALKPNLADYVALYAKTKKNAIALIEHNTDARVTWKQFDTSVSAFAAKLLSIGLKKGDILATSLPLLKEHVYLMYACYRTGIVLAPLDLRLKAKEIQYCLDRLSPKAYFFLGKTAVADFRPMIREVMAQSPFVRHWVQFQQEEDLVMEGAVGIGAFVKDIKKVFIKSLFTGSVRRAHQAVAKRDPCLIIFTTGSTGSPKPALLCHEGILTQNIGLAGAFEIRDNDVFLINLPPSHVGCTTEQLATTIYGGGVSVLLHIFDPKMSLEAIAAHKVTCLGQIPALFNMQWRLPDYQRYDLSSLRFAIYGGQAVSREFLVKMKQMAPQIGTGLGLTETSGFCTYTDIDAGVDEIARSIGHAMPLCPLTIREPMAADGSAGEEKPGGEVGEICFSGPQIFIGYLNDPENTAKTISTDGICYTGDLGYYDDEGLHFAGRSKLVIKPKGYQVFPDDVEHHIAEKLKSKINQIAVVGAPHEVYSEGIIAFVEPIEGVTLTVEEVMAACQDISAYSRPSHVEILPAGQFPLNRVAKTDYMSLRDAAQAVVERLRAEGRWDAA